MPYKLFLINTFMWPRNEGSSELGRGTWRPKRKPPPVSTATFPGFGCNTPGRVPVISWWMGEKKSLGHRITPWPWPCLRQEVTLESCGVPAFGWWRSSGNTGIFTHHDRMCGIPGEHFGCGWKHPCCWRQKGAFLWGSRSNLDRINNNVAVISAQAIEGTRIWKIHLLVSPFSCFLNQVLPNSDSWIGAN